MDLSLQLHDFFLLLFNPSLQTDHLKQKIEKLVGVIIRNFTGDAMYPHTHLKIWSNQKWNPQMFPGCVDFRYDPIYLLFYGPQAIHFRAKYIRILHTVSLQKKSSLCRSWVAVGRTSGSLLVSFLTYSARTGHLWQNDSGIFPSLRSPRVRTRSISVPKGWKSSRATTPTLYMSDWKSRINMNSV